jgi:hypothetical protein
MKLRYYVDMQNCFRHGVNCNSAVQILEVDPNELSPDVRVMIADRLMPAEHIEIGLMDVCYLNAAEAYVTGDTLIIGRAFPVDGTDSVDHLITAPLLGLEHLVAAIRQEEKEIADYLDGKELHYKCKEIL